MAIAVIIPLYNGAKWIRETLDSVFAQRLKPEEVIVVDDGSTDGSPELIKSYPGVRFLVKDSAIKKGGTASRNFGLSHTRAERVAFLDQDDLWHPEHLALLNGTLERHPEVSAAVAQMRPFQDGSDVRYDLSDVGVETFDPWEFYPMHGLGCAPATALFRRKALEEAGGWPEEHSGMSDYSLWLRLSSRTQMVRLRAWTVAHRRHGQSNFIQLRQRDLWRYLRLGLRVTDEALAYRSSFLKNEEEKRTLTRRSLLAHDQYNLVEAFAKGDMQATQEFIRRQEKKLENEEETYVSNTLFRLANLIRDAESDYLKLLKHWPKEARRTREAMLRILIEDRPGATFYLKYYFGHPCQISRLKVLFSALLNKFSVKEEFWKERKSGRYLRMNHAKS